MHLFGANSSPYCLAQYNLNKLNRINYMKKIFFYCLFFIATMGSTFAQKEIDIALAYNKGTTLSGSYDKFWGKKLKIGLGLRANLHSSGHSMYITAPAELTSGKKSLAAFFTPYSNEKLDTLHMNSAAIVALNTKFALQYQVFKKTSIGFNIDLLGFSFGPEKDGRFSAAENKQLNNSIQAAKPTAFNILLISDSDRGSLNSELYLKKQLKSNNYLRLGASFQFNEYTTTNTLTFNNDRFRRKNLMPFLAYTISLK
jgi:hypothetical protein